jgi:BCCT family betaine/carnitine transporter
MTTPRPHWSTTIDPSRYHASARAFGRLTVNPPVFFASALVTLAAIVAILIRGDASAALFEAIRLAILSHCDNFLMLSGDLFLIVCVGLMLSPYGRIRLGHDDERPTYSALAWFSMLFGAGMGIGLVFYGVAEPITHYAASLAPAGSAAAAAAPPGGAPGFPDAARDIAMAAAIFNWSLHPWAIYAILGLALALFSYRLDMPMSLRSACYPLFGQRVWGPLGDVIDVLAIFATLGGLTTSLGLGAQQAMAGISFLYGVAPSLWAQFLLIAVMAFFTFLSVWGGIERGIRLMSELNLWLAIALVLFILTPDRPCSCCANWA